MGKGLVYPLSVMLLLFAALNSCSSDDDIDIPSELYSTWELTNTEEYSSSGRYIFYSDGTLEVYGMFPDFFPSTGSYHYSLQLDERTEKDALSSGTMYVDDTFFLFTIRNNHENPEILELVLFHSTLSGEGAIVLQKKLENDDKLLQYSNI